MFVIELKFYVMSKTKPLHYELCCKGAEWLMKKPWANLKYVAVENSESYKNETFVEVLEKFEELGLNIDF